MTPGIRWLHRHYFLHA